MTGERTATVKAQHKDTTGIINKKIYKSQAIQQLEAKSLEIKKAKYPNVPYLTATKYRDDSTNDLTRCVIDCIQFNGGQAERINSTGRQITTKGVTKMIPGSSTKGTADISATIMGRSVKIEIKCSATGDRYQSDVQRNYQQAVERAGGVYIIVRDFDGFNEWFNRFVNGK